MSVRRATGGFTAAGLLGLAAAAQGAGAPAIHADHGCYLVGQLVHLTGRGFAAGRTFDLAVDGVDFGQSTTDALGGFTVKVGLGGLRGVAQHVEAVSASDGSAEAATTVTLTARPGARILATRGTVTTLRAPVEVWGFSPNGPRRRVYLHYVTPSGRAARSVSLGSTSGPCGYLRTASRRVFPFAPARGTWTLQVDTQGAYAARPAGPVQRIRVTVR